MHFMTDVASLSQNTLHKSIKENMPSREAVKTEPDEIEISFDK